MVHRGGVRMIRDSILAAVADQGACMMLIGA